MFSFFSKSKKSHPPETDPIPSSAQQPDDFIFVEPNPNRQPQPHHGNMYPGLHGGGAGGPMNFPPQPTLPPKREQEQVSYLHGVPFKLASSLTTGEGAEITKMQTDQIAMFFNRRNDTGVDYDFTLEREIIGS